MLCFLLLVASGAYAQTVSISGVVQDSKGNPIEAAAVSLLNSSDSTLVKAELSDMTGKYDFPQLKAGAYWLSIYTLGYERFSSDLIQATVPGENVVVKPVTLLTSTTALKQVTISAKKPFIERKTDRTIVNVESRFLAPGVGREVLRKKSVGRDKAGRRGTCLQAHQGPRFRHFSISNQITNTNPSPALIPN